MWEWERKKDVLPKPVNCQFALILMAVEDLTLSQLTGVSCLNSSALFGSESKRQKYLESLFDVTLHT